MWDRAVLPMQNELSHLFSDKKVSSRKLRNSLIFCSLDLKINVSSWIIMPKITNDFPRQKVASWRLAGSLPPGMLFISSGRYAAEADVQNLVASMQRAWVTFTRHRKIDELIDRFRARNGPKSLQK